MSMRKQKIHSGKKNKIVSCPNGLTEYGLNLWKERAELDIKPRPRRQDVKAIFVVTDGLSKKESICTSMVKNAIVFGDFAVYPTLSRNGTGKNKRRLYTVGGDDGTCYFEGLNKGDALIICRRLNQIKSSLSQKMVRCFQDIGDIFLDLNRITKEGEFISLSMEDLITEEIEIPDSLFENERFLQSFMKIYDPLQPSQNTITVYRVKKETFAIAKVSNQNGESFVPFPIEVSSKSKYGITGINRMFQDLADVCSGSSKFISTMYEVFVEKIFPEDPNVFSVWSKAIALKDPSRFKDILPKSFFVNRVIENDIPYVANDCFLMDKKLATESFMSRIIPVQDSKKALPLKALEQVFEKFNSETTFEYLHHVLWVGVIGNHVLGLGVSQNDCLIPPRIVTVPIQIVQIILDLDVFSRKMGLHEIFDVNGSFNFAYPDFKNKINIYFETRRNMILIYEDKKIIGIFACPQSRGDADFQKEAKVARREAEHPLREFDSLFTFINAISLGEKFIENNIDVLETEFSESKNNENSTSDTMEKETMEGHPSDVPVTTKRKRGRPRKNSAIAHSNLESASNADENANAKRMNLDISAIQQDIPQDKNQNQNGSPKREGALDAPPLSSLSSHKASDPAPSPPDSVPPPNTIHISEDLHEKPHGIPSIPAPISSARGAEERLPFVLETANKQK